MIRTIQTVVEHGVKYTVITHDSCDGVKKYFYKYQTSSLHREHNLPAIDAPGEKWYYYDNQLHRTDGPAYEHDFYPLEWYFHGIRIEVRSQPKFEQWLKLRAFE